MRRAPPGNPLDACRRLLEIMEQSFPAEEVAADYFLNLKILLSARPRLEKPGQLVIGVGPGRCGSTSLAAMLETAPNSCCTHETPPLIFWSPQNEQVDFHVKRFRLLTDYFSLVADISHWWLNSIERVFAQLPNAKAIGLIRNPNDCALSFMRIQGFGRGSFNPWARGNDFWRSGNWDPTYPTYTLPHYAERSPDFAKFTLITRYVREYNAQLETMAQALPGRVALVRTEELSISEVQGRIFQMAGMNGQRSTQKLNVRRVTDGKKNQIKF
jgi:hypothetical protein